MQEGTEFQQIASHATEPENNVCSSSSDDVTGLSRGSCALGNSASLVRAIDLHDATRIPQSRRCDTLGLGGGSHSHGRQLPIPAGVDGARRCRGRSASRHDMAMESPRPNHVGEHSGATPMRDQAVVTDLETDTPYPADGHRHPAGGVGVRSADMRRQSRCSLDGERSHW